MKSKILLAVSAVSIVLSSVTSGWSNPTDKLPAPPPTNVDRPVDNSTNTNANTTNTETSTKATFACEAKEDLLLTIAKVEGKDDLAIFDWDEQHFSDRIKATEICEKAATKLQAYYDSGKLKNISFASGKIDDKPLLCIQEIKEGQTVNGRSSGCLDTDEVLANLDTSQKAGEVLCDVIVDEEQKPQSCKIQHRGDFTMRFRFNWFPF
jgi:Circadian oscillating protein COP23